jgi:hypothetical protein
MISSDFYIGNFGVFLATLIAGFLSLVGTAGVLFMFWMLKKQRTLPSRFVAMLSFNYFLFNLNQMVFLAAGPHLDLVKDPWHYCKMSAYTNNYFFFTAFMWTCVIAWSVK